MNRYKSLSEYYLKINLRPLLKLKHMAGLFFNNIIKSTELIASVMLILMVLLTSYDVVMRYVFNSGSVGLQELEWHLFSAIFLLGGSVALRDDKHVRVDVIYQSSWLSQKKRALINIFGTIFFLTPFCIIVIWASTPFVYDAYIHNEMSPDPGGLPYRWIIKSILPIGFGLILIQGFANLHKNISVVLKT